MTISTTTNKVRIAGDGITTGFQFIFPLLKNDYSDLRVYKIDINHNTQIETSTLLYITTNYTLTISKNTEQRIIGGYVNLIDNNSNPLALTINQALFIKRIETLTQDTDLSEGDKFPYQVLENSLDKLTIITQQQQEEINRTLKLSSYTQSELSEEFETPIESKGLMWGKDSNNKFYIKNTKENPDDVYNSIVQNQNVIAIGNDLNGTNNIGKVANNETNINALNSNKINIDTVAVNINNVNTVANNIDDLKNKANKDLSNLSDNGNALTNKSQFILNQTVDLNNYINPGLYFFSNCTIINQPSELSVTYLWFQVYREKNDYCLQKIITTDSSSQYTRSGYSPNWNSWKSTSCYMMPSNRYIDLTVSVGVDTIFTAPANGYYSARTGNVAGFIQILKQKIGGGILYGASNFNTAVYNSVIIPIMKGESVVITVGGSIDFCRFIYANDN